MRLVVLWHVEPVGAHRLASGSACLASSGGEDGLVRLAPNLGWRDVPFTKILAERLGPDRHAGRPGQ